ncbi:MAG TPA: DUF4244 domain-containing protein [Jiangellales bacterium]|nr:DUF4244 domain-containing protein [Jiangellales bacterium]
MSATPSTALATAQPRSRSRVMRRLRRDERGMTTAEYAVGTVAACGFAGILYKLVTSDTVLSLLTEIIKRAFGLLG